MGKAKSSKSTSVPNRTLHSRISYLYQAASYLSQQHQGQPSPKQIAKSTPSSLPSKPDDSTGRKDLSNISNTKCQLTSTLGPTSTGEGSTSAKETKEADLVSRSSASSNLPLTRHLLFHLREVSLKAQVRLSPSIKHSVCKRCHALLVPGTSSTLRMENQSRNGRKPWADVLVLSCSACGAEKRFPAGSQRPAKRGLRSRQTRLVPDEAGQLE
ncbi:MAG: hypothetical protein M1837_002673 [Sclerophora amabilis]|nr:MAG: hypothetical protein M1837_002673 [Sclerophora amabilis]